MDVKKATEIVESLGVIDVDYKGKSVWIENIFESTNEAEIKDLETGKKYKVSVSKLEEK
jgi:small acid-soluble spore protein H (minor)